MSRYIDADAVLDVLRSEKGSFALGHSTRRLVNIISVINEIPTADVVPKSEVDMWFRECEELQERLIEAVKGGANG